MMQRCAGFCQHTINLKGRAAAGKACLGAVCAIALHASVSRHTRSANLSLCGRQSPPLSAAGAAGLDTVRLDDARVTAHP